MCVNQVCAIQCVFAWVAVQMCLSSKDDGLACVSTHYHFTAAHLVHPHNGLSFVQPYPLSRDNRHVHTILLQHRFTHLLCEHVLFVLGTHRAMQSYHSHSHLRKHVPRLRDVRGKVERLHAVVVGRRAD